MDCDFKKLANFLKFFLRLLRVLKKAFETDCRLKKNVMFIVSPVEYFRTPVGYFRTLVGYFRTPVGYFRAPFGYFRTPVGCSYPLINDLFVLR